MSDPSSAVKRYSPFDRDEVHTDMAADPAATARSLAAQPSVADAHRDCAVCAELAPPPTPRAPERTGKVRLTLQQVSDLLGMQPGYRPVRMYVTNDPHSLVVVVEGEAFDPVPDGAAAPIIQV